MAEQKKKAHRSQGSQLNHLAVPARKSHPAQVLCRILQSSGLKAMGEYSQKHGLQKVIESPQVIAAVARYEKRKETAERKAAARAKAAKAAEAAKTDESVAQQADA